MNALLGLLYLILCVGIVVFVPTLVAPYAAEYGATSVFDLSRAVLLATVIAGVAGFYAYKAEIDGPFLFRLFVAGMLARMLVGVAIFVFKGQEFFGGDALTYDFVGYAQLGGWTGNRHLGGAAQAFLQNPGSGWGMVYMVAVIYGIVGRNMLAVQLVNSVLGATTAVVIYRCAHEVFRNTRVARVAGIAVAFYPSLILWSSQGLKDGPIVICLSLAILATLKLGQKLSIRYTSVLVFSLLAVLSLRFYVFYMLAAAIAGAFVIGMQSITATSFARQLAAILLVGLALTYFGVTRFADLQFQEYGNLERVQRSRLDLARSADSGFGRDVDVSTTAGAISTIPLGMVYLLFAPFPWQVGSLRQSITLPEMIVWWASFPLLILGLWFAIRYRLRMIAPILVFTVMLTLSYSVFQGNVGTAYRQRAQLLVFYFIFVAVGYVLVMEKREERKRQRKEALVAQQAVATAARSARSR